MRTHVRVVELVEAHNVLTNDQKATRRHFSALEISGNVLATKDAKDDLWERVVDATSQGDAREIQWHRGADVLQLKELEIVAVGRLIVDFRDAQGVV